MVAQLPKGHKWIGGKGSNKKITAGGAALAA
jgi:hypothetical protein